MKNYKSIVSEIHIQVSPLLPSGMTMSIFSDGGGSFGVSYYSHIFNSEGESIITLRISDHTSHCLFADNCICGSWNHPEIFIEKIKKFLAPKKSIVVEMSGEYPNEQAILKVYANAQNIVQGDFVRIAKKSGNPVYNFTFTISKTVLA
jgi:hypothetical protein